MYLKTIIYLIVVTSLNGHFDVFGSEGEKLPNVVRLVDDSLKAIQPELKEEICAGINLRNSFSNTGQELIESLGDNIFHVRQTHKNPITKVDFEEKAFKSQYSIFQAVLAEEQQPLLFAEGCAERFSYVNEKESDPCISLVLDEVEKMKPENKERLEDCRKIVRQKYFQDKYKKQFFVNGDGGEIKPLDDWDDEMRRILYHQGASILLLLLGKVSDVFPTQEEELNKRSIRESEIMLGRIAEEVTHRFNKVMDPGIKQAPVLTYEEIKGSESQSSKYWKYTARERVALDLVKKYRDEVDPKRERKVFLIFGANHNFSWLRRKGRPATE